MCQRSGTDILVSEPQQSHDDQNYLIKLERQDLITSLSNFNEIRERPRLSRGFESTSLRVRFSEDAI